MLYDSGLKAREVLLEDLRFLFRYEEQILRDGFYTDAEFFNAVIESYEDYIEGQDEE